MSDDEKEEDGDGYEYISSEDVTVDQELREENVQHVSFEWCKAVRQVGERYWGREEEAHLSALSDEFDLSEDEVSQAAITYYLIYDTQAGDLKGVSSAAFSVMTKFFRDSESIGKIAEDTEEGPDVVRRRVREYVGGVLKHLSPEKIDLGEIDELPSPPQTMSERLHGATTIRAADLSGIHSAIQDTNSAVQAFRASDAISNVIQSTQVLQSAEYQAALQGIRMPSNAVRSISEFTEAIRRVRQLTSDPNLWRQVHEYITRAILDGITNFDSPENYDPDSVEVDSFVKEHGIETLDDMCSSIEDETDNELDAYLDRTIIGMEAYNQRDYVTAIFLFISLQDGLMAALCEWERGPPSGGYYEADEKRETLREVSTGYYGIEDHQLVGILEGFYDHRNAIMHGAPEAYFDENIATIALLFLVMTYEAILGYREA